MIKMLDNKYLTVSETAALAGCTESYVRWLIREGQLRFQQIGKKTYLIPVDDARKFAVKPRKGGRPRKNDKN
jgi:excisionase family DNA binding protein